MKTLILMSLMLGVFNINLLAQSRCRAVTTAKTQCQRHAVIEGYCKQHYTIKTAKPIPGKVMVNLPEEWAAISTNPSKPDVMVAWLDTRTNIIHITFKQEQDD